MAFSLFSFAYLKRIFSVVLCGILAYARCSVFPNFFILKGFLTPQSTTAKNTSWQIGRKRVYF